MLTLRRILVSLLAIGVALTVVRIHGESRAAQDLKFDLAEIDDVRYGLFDVEVWLDHLLVVMDAQIEEFGETASQREAVEASIEAVIRQLVTEVETTIRRQNEERPFGSLRQLATDFVIDFDELRDNSDAYAAIAVEEIERPENKERLKTYLRARVSAFADSTFVATDRSRFDAVLDRRGCGNRADCRSRIGAELAERNRGLAGRTSLAIGLALVLILLAVWPPRRFGVVELSAVLAGVFALLIGGLVTPMIDIEAEILRLDLEIAGEAIAFENQVLFFQSKSIIDVVDLLVRTGRLDLVLVGVGLVTFSVVFPVAKLLATFAYRFRRSLRGVRPIRFFALESGKWSMADVFVVAMFLAFLGFDGLTGNQLAALMAGSQLVDVETQNGTALGIGFYLFTAFCFGGLVLSSVVKRSSGLDPATDGDSQGEAGGETR